RIAPATAPPITFFLPAFGSSPTTLVFSSEASGVTSPDTSYVLSLITIERTRKAICALSALEPAVTDATSNTMVAPAGSVAPFEPVTALFTIATNLSPAKLVFVHTRLPLVSETLVPEPNSFGAAAGSAGATAAAVGDGCRT